MIFFGKLEKRIEDLEKQLKESNSKIEKLEAALARDDKDIKTLGNMIAVWGGLVNDLFSQFDTEKAVIDFILETLGLGSKKTKDNFGFPSGGNKNNLPS